MIVKNFNKIGINLENKDLNSRLFTQGKRTHYKMTDAKKEQSVIKQKIKKSCSLYNTDKATSFIVNYRREIEIDGEIFPSVAQAAKHPNITISETTIWRRLLNLNYPTYREIQRSLNGYTPATINNDKFQSISAAVEAGVANNRQTVMRKVSSTNVKWANWKISE
jgi:hypothetical protein